MSNMYERNSNNPSSVANGTEFVTAQPFPFWGADKAEAEAFLGAMAGTYVAAPDDPVTGMTATVIAEGTVGGFDITNSSAALLNVNVVYSPHCPSYFEADDCLSHNDPAQYGPPAMVQSLYVRAANEDGMTFPTVLFDSWAKKESLANVGLSHVPPFLSVFKVRAYLAFRN